MIHIEHVNMHLPAAFQHRVTSITRLLGEILANEPISEDAFIEKLELRPSRIKPGTSDAELAKIIAQQLLSKIRGNNDV